MKYLLDTHTFLWALFESSKIPKKASSVIRDPHNEVFVSAVSFWEIAIKARSKKLDLGGMAVTELTTHAEKLGLQFLSLTAEEALSYGELTENTHFDPFDRMLIWQALQKNCTIISEDAEFEKFLSHGLKILWK